MKELILNKITEQDILDRYFPGTISLGKKYKNPWRSDNSGEAYFDNKYGKLLFIDWASSPQHMDCFYIAEKALGLDNFKDTCNQISKDFNLGLHRPKNILDFSVLGSDIRVKPKKLIPLEPKEVNEKAKITIQVQKFTEDDLAYWKQFGISLPTLIRYNVRSCYRAWINGLFYQEYINRDPMYVYTEKGIDYKIYRPRASKAFKWRSNMIGGILEGWEQLPEKGNLLIITKSRKDVMTLHECGFNAVACKSESSLISNNAMNLLKRRFRTIIMFYDNDEAGRIYSNKLAYKYELGQIELPQDSSGSLPKDPSDFNKIYGRKHLIKFLNDNISIHK